MYGITEEEIKKIHSDVMWKHRYQDKKRNRPNRNEMMNVDASELEVFYKGVWVSYQEYSLYNLRGYKCRIATSKMWLSQNGELRQTISYQFAKKAIREFVNEHNSHNFWQQPELIF